MNGKIKCGALKQIRRDIANANGITLDIPECTHTGDCPGTCPRCEAEVRYLERALAARRKRGLKVAVAGISAGLVALNTTSCEPVERIAELIHGTQTAGDMVVETSQLGGKVVALDTEITLDGDMPVLPVEDGEAEDGAVTDAAVAGFIQADPDSFDETLPTTVYELDGSISYAPEDECEVTE